jgi:hypothetical protein
MTNERHLLRKREALLLSQTLHAGSVCLHGLRLCLRHVCDYPKGVLCAYSALTNRLQDWAHQLPRLGNPHSPYVRCLRLYCATSGRRHGHATRMAAARCANT